MKTQKKSPLTPEQLAECAALKKIFTEKKDALRLTQEKVADLMGMNQGSVSHYLNGRNALNLSFSAHIAKILDVPVSEFSPRIARKLDELIGKDKDPETTKGGPESEHANVGLAVQPWRAPRRYPLISWIAAGARAESPDNFIAGNADEHLESTENAGDRGYWLDVRGPSMTAQTTPSFPEGTKILVRPEGFDLISGKFYVARHRDGEKTFKQYLYDAGTEYLIPLNPTFKPLEMDEDWEIIGRVIDAKIPGL